MKASGTDFQIKAWKALEAIPYGETRSYLEEATMIGNPNSRATAKMVTNAKSLTP